MGCMLIHNHEPISSLGNDIGLRHLPASHSQRKTPTLWRRCISGFGASLWRRRCKTGAAVAKSLIGHWRCGPVIGKDGHRSEEHTSELQSLMRISYAVFCLKKK